MGILRLDIAVVAVVALACVSRVPPPNRGTTTGTAAAVRATRARWNAAVATRDTAAVAPLAADRILQSSPFFVRIGRDHYLTGLANNFARRPGFALVFFPEQVEASVAFGGSLATEYGRWRETWLEDREPTEIRGTYYAVWHARTGGWEIIREVFAPQSCTGQRYCSR